tara:strand:- start:58 stop:423 length:366 start_codon:yes stop_codon:yes gene_type:complete
MLNYTKPELVQELSEGVKRIVFREVTSGEKSADLVTLRQDLVPATEILTMVRMIERMEVVPDTRVYAWDIVKGKWISFYMEKVDSLDEARTSDDISEEEQEVDEQTRIKNLINLDNGQQLQ